MHCKLIYIDSSQERKEKNTGKHNRVHFSACLRTDLQLSNRMQKRVQDPKEKEGSSMPLSLGLIPIQIQLLAQRSGPQLMQLYCQKGTLWPKPTASTEQEMPIPQCAPALWSSSSPRTAAELQCRGTLGKQEWVRALSKHIPVGIPCRCTSQD